MKQKLLIFIKSLLLKILNYIEKVGYMERYLTVAYAFKLIGNNRIFNVSEPLKETGLLDPEFDRAKFMEAIRLLIPNIETIWILDVGHLTPEQYDTIIAQQLSELR